MGNNYEDLPDIELDLYLEKYKNIVESESDTKLKIAAKKVYNKLKHEFMRRNNEHI